MNLTFLIPVKLESDDRVRNLTTVLSFLLTNFDSQVLVKESDTIPRFESLVLPNLKNINNLDYSFEKQHENFFHKTKILNDLIGYNSKKIKLYVKKFTLSSIYCLIIYNFSINS